MHSLARSWAVVNIMHPRCSIKFHSMDPNGPNFNVYRAYPSCVVFELSATSYIDKLPNESKVVSFDGRRTQRTHILGLILA